MEKFLVYESLGNRFLIFDLRNVVIQATEEKAPKAARPEGSRSIKMRSDRLEGCPKGVRLFDCSSEILNLCKKNGVDGVLIIKASPSGDIETEIYNADGSDGGLCLNGARCIADYLYRQEPHKTISFLMGKTRIKNDIEEIGGSALITQTIDIATPPTYEKKTINISDKNLVGHAVDIGNPHFIMFEEENMHLDEKTFFSIAPSIENHIEFPSRTNVEYITQENNNTYHLIVHERGCGPTPACSSGAAALTWLLYKESGIKKPITIKMPGGEITTRVTENCCLSLRGKAKEIT